MRIENYKKVEGHESLVRDSDSNAIVATNEIEYASYLNKREHAIQSAKILKKNTEEIHQIKCDLLEIKSMLYSLIKGS